jgi:hypothetical protein
MRYNIRFDFLEDNHYSELKDAEILTQRVTLLQQIDPYVGRYYSDEWVKRNLLRMSDDDIKLMDKQIKDSLATNISFAQNKGEQNLAQQQPTMEFQQQQQMAAAEQQAKLQPQQDPNQPQAAAAQEAQTQEAGDADEAKSESKTKSKPAAKKSSWPN